MVANMKKIFHNKRVNYLVPFILPTIMLFTVAGCSSDGAPRFKDMEEVEHKLSTTGVICEVEEVEPGDSFLVLNEEIIDDKEKSVAIVHNLDGTTDTLSLATLKKEGLHTPRHSAIGGFLMTTLAATYFMNNVSGFKPNPASYKNPAAHTKSAGLASNVQSTATTKRTKVPGKGSKGYGSGKSFRSFGG